MDTQTVLILLAQQGANGAADGSQGGGWRQILLCSAMAIGIGLIWYFVFIRPKQQEKEERNEMLDNLEEHDEVVTIGGLRGKITAVEEEHISVRIDEDNNITVECERWAIRDNLTKQDDEEKDNEKNS